jgi:hypothetical protein
MGTIYGRAEEEIIWLGPRGDHSKSGMEFLAEVMRFNGRCIPKDFCLNISYRLAFVGIAMLAKREYWNRVWTIQEIFKARKLKIFCGYQTLRMEKFGKILSRAFSRAPYSG